MLFVCVWQAANDCQIDENRSAYINEFYEFKDFSSSRSQAKAFITPASMSAAIAASWLFVFNLLSF